MVVIQKEITEEGEVIPWQQSDLECGSESDGTNDRVIIKFVFIELVEIVFSTASPEYVPNV